MAKDKMTPENFARDHKFAMAFASELLNDWIFLRSQRAERETRWQDGYDQWSLGKQDPLNVENYIGRANIKYPAIRKEVETMSRRLLKALFPEDYIKADPTLTMSSDMAIANTMVVKHYYDNITKLKQSIAPHIKQTVLYGTSAVRSFWRKDVNEIIYKKKIFDQGPNGELIPNLIKVKEQVTNYEGPVIRTEDMFQVWVYPSTINDPREAKRIYFRTKVDWKFLKECEAKGIFYKVDRVKDQGKERDIPFDMKQQQLQSMGDSGEFSEHREGKLYDLLEVWGKAIMPDGKLTNYVFAVINENPEWCIRLQQNPYWHQTPPFDFGRFILPPGNEFYGRGLPEAIMDMSHMLNDIINQGLDSATLNLNAITIVNPAFAPNADSFEVEPGAMWFADPNAVKAMEFPDYAKTMTSSMSMVKAAITEASDNTPQLPDPISGKARSTGQSQLAMNEWQTDMYYFANTLGTECFESLTQKVHSLLQQNLPDEAVIKITGKYAGQWINRVVTPTDICGNLNFNWLCAMQIENQSVKTQQMLNFLKVLPTIPPQELAKINVKWDALLGILLRDGFQVRQPEQIISSDHLTSVVDPNIENKILNMGGDVEVNPDDNDDAHIMQHKYGQSQLDRKDIEFKYHFAKYDEHIADHERQKQQKVQAAQQQQMLMAANGGQMPPPPMQGNKPVNLPRTGHHTPSNPMGNQAQMSQGVPTGANLMKGVRP